MQWRNVLILGLVFVAALLPRVLDLGAFISPDEPRWQQNTLGFREGLTEGNWSKLYQQPHPGITTMWLAAPLIHTEDWAIIRLPAAVAIAGLITLVAWVSMRLWGTWIGLGVGLLMAVNPHFIAHSRVLAMDALLSIFILLALLFLLLWQKEKARMWIVLSGVCAALAVLSKIIGIVVVAFIPLVLIWDQVRMRRFEWKTWAYYVGAVLLTTVIILPTVVTDFDVVWKGTQEFFATEHYSQQVHALGPLWYPQAFLLWTTPVQLLGLVTAAAALAIAGSRRFALRANRAQTQPRSLAEGESHARSASVNPAIATPQQLTNNIFLLFLFAFLFFLAIQYSIKKGDRYMLPDFVMFDLLAVLGIAAAYTSLHVRSVKRGLLLLVLVGLGWQVWSLFELHPHYLAYRNPFFRSVAEGRTMGWGEGLDLAAEYLNQKPGAERMLVLAYYEGQFGYKFKGEVTGVERLAKETVEDVGADYVVLYRTMQGRAPERWETKVLKQFTDAKPEHVISLNGEKYVWIYKIK